MKEPASVPSATAYCHVTWNTSFVSLCASGFSSVKWAQEFNWLPSSLSRTLRTDTLKSLEDKMPPYVFFDILTCLVSMYYMSYTVVRCDIVNFFYEKKVVCMPPCETITLLFMFYVFWTWFFIFLSRAAGTVPLNVSVYPAVPGWAVGGGGTGFGGSLLEVCREVVQVG